MNIFMILYVLGHIMRIESLLMIPSVLVAFIYNEDSTSFLMTIAILFIVGTICVYKKPKDELFLAKDGYVTVGLSWVVLSLFGALPFYFSGAIPSFIDCFFEIVSGFTTTGSTILTNVEAMDYSLLFWRSFSHWIGGMGILVFALAIVPLAAQGKSMHLLRAESPGMTVGKLVPKIKKTAKILYLIYIALTVIEIIILIAVGMPIFDSFIHAFGTAGTGGFSIYGASIAYYNSPVIEIVITIFLFLFAINFNIFYLLLLKQFKQVLLNEELRIYLIICVLSIVAITINILPLYDSLGEALRLAGFQVGSIISTAGFSTCDFNTWPSFSKMVLLMLMFVGGCAGSTAGGLKVSRIIVLFKNIKHELYALIRPRNISNVTLNGHIVDNKVRNNANVYFVTYIFIFLFSLFIISLDGFDMMTNFSGVSACLNNVGPGFNLVGPMGNFADFSVLSKIVLSFDMILGRLEIFPLLLLIFPITYSNR